MSGHILIIDDEVSIARTLRPVLEAQGYTVDIAGDAREGLARAKARQVDVTLLDLGLPDADGIEIIRKLRALNEGPIIVLSARQLEAEKVRALDEGAHDYIDKPFGIEELLARLRAAIRQRSAQARDATEFKSTDLWLNYSTRRAQVLGEDVKFSPKEFAILEELSRQAGQVVTQRRLLLAGWNDPNVDPQYLRSYIALIRQKLEEDPSEPTILLTEPGVGYRLVCVAS